MSVKIISESPEKTKKIGSKFAELLNPGDVVFLLGELGGGKTTFISGVAEGLNAKGNVSSPSFTLINIYDYKKDNNHLNLVHCDLYRVSGFKDIPDIGIEEYIYDGKSIVFIEWGNFLKEKISKDYLVIKFDYIFDDITEEGSIETQDQKRQLTFSAENTYWRLKLRSFKDIKFLKIKKSYL
jgi:tRNA threonylcarbamoyladenosine biosynthesis protein TsaE